MKYVPKINNQAQWMVTTIILTPENRQMFKYEEILGNQMKNIAVIIVYCAYWLANFKLTYRRLVTSATIK